MRTTTTPVLGLVAILAAACSSAGGERHRRPSPSRRPPPSSPRPPRRPRRRSRRPRRRRVHRGQPHAADRRQAHDRHRQPGLPAVLRRERRRPQDRSVGARRPDQRAGLRERRRLRARREARLRQGPGRLDRTSPSTTRTRRAQDVRHRHQPGLSTSPSGRRPSTCRRLLLRQPGARRRSRPTRSPRSPPSPRCKDYVLGAQVGTTSLDAITDVIKPPTRAARLRHERRGDRRAQGQADRRHRGRPADRLLHHRRPDRERARSSASSAAEGGDAEHFSAVLAKGSPLTDVRQRGDRGADRRRHARATSPGVAVRQGDGAGLHAVAGRRDPGRWAAGTVTTGDRAARRATRRRDDRVRCDRPSIALVSTVVVFGGLAWVIVHAPSWPRGPEDRS